SYVRGGIPLRSSMCAIWIAEGDVDSRIFLILQNLPNHILQLNIGSNREFSHQVAILIGMGVAPEIGFQFAIIRMGFRKPVTLYMNGQRILSQAAELCAQVVSHHAMAHSRSTQCSVTSKDYVSWQVSPVVGI